MFNARTTSTPNSSLTLPRCVLELTPSTVSQSLSMVGISSYENVFDQPLSLTTLK